MYTIHVLEYTVCHSRGLGPGGVVLELGVVDGKERSVVTGVLQRVDQTVGGATSVQGTRYFIK